MEEKNTTPKMSLSEYFYSREIQEKEEREKRKPEPYVIKVDGIQVFSANYVHEQIMYTSIRIDRWALLGKISFAVSIVSLIVSLIAITLFLS